MMLQMKLNDVTLSYLESCLMTFDLVYSSVLREFEVVDEKM